MDLPNPNEVASQLLRNAGLTEPPVDLDRVSSLWPNLKISMEDLDCEGYILDIGRLGAEIIVRADDILPRRRFSIAHELGHWILKLAGQDTGHDVQHATLERWCDRFAACLLMPQEWIVRDLRAVALAGLADALLTFPNRYQVSHRAFRLRVSELTPVSVYEFKQKPTGTVIIEKRYEAPSIPKSDLSLALRKISALLGDPKVPTRYFHEDTRLLSLHKRCISKRDTRKWLVCVLPKERVTSNKLAPALSNR